MKMISSTSNHGIVHPRWRYEMDECEASEGSFIHVGEQVLRAAARDKYPLFASVNLLLDSPRR